MTKIAPYGSWASPISAELVAGNARHMSQLVVDGGSVYWTESRPQEGGRLALMRVDASGELSEVSRPDMNVRTRVHEYGGGSYVAQNGVVAYVNFADQFLYRVDGEDVQPLTTDGMRYADGVVDVRRNRIVCVREDHTSDGEPKNTIVAVDLGKRGPGDVLVAGHDFYSTPRLSPDGNRLCWVAWNHPEMPWTRTSLWLADIAEDGTLANFRCPVSGDESVFQPAWSPDGTLYFVSDRSGWWNLYRLDGETVHAIAPMDAEFGRPQWVFGVPTYGVRDAQRVVCSYTQDGMWRLAEVNADTGSMRALDVPHTSISDVQVADDCLYFLGAAADTAQEAVRLDLESGVRTILRQTEQPDSLDGYLSMPRSVEFPTTDGVAYGIFYPPKNADFSAPEGEKPPLIVMIHGGPTSVSTSAYSLSIQFWTSRGFAVLDVNYGGSTGYGRAYRQRLDDRWGIVDVDDCCAGARYLAEKGEVDAERMVIRGGSAGGFTTLAALTFANVFRAGASYFGVSDLGALAEETHKFESRYLDGLVGPYPERKDIYAARSPIYHVDQLNCPIIFFQGLEDRVVPPNQAEEMVDALRKKGLPVAYLAYEGEQHGFRRSENMIRSLTAELYFYAKVFSIPVGADIEPVAIENLPESA